MGQHYTLNTIETSAWCNKCHASTPHRVAQRRLQFCIPCWDKSKMESDAEKARQAVEQEIAAKQGKLF